MTGYDCLLTSVVSAQQQLTRGRISNFLLITVEVLAVFAVAILVFELWRWILLIGLIAIVIYMIRDNLSEPALSSTHQP